MKQTQRHDAIIELVKKQGYVSTEELVEHFSVSPQTIRRDLNDLADQNNQSLIQMELSTLFVTCAKSNDPADPGNVSNDTRSFFIHVFSLCTFVR